MAEMEGTVSLAVRTPFRFYPRCASAIQRTAPGTRKQRHQPVKRSTPTASPLISCIKMYTMFYSLLIFIFSVLCSRAIAFSITTLSSKILYTREASNRRSNKLALYVFMSHDNDDNVMINDIASPTQPYFPRRHFLSLVSYALPAAIMLQSNDAIAAAPLTAEEADNVSARIERALRLKPPKVLRTRMNLDFAVLLMRSSYNAVDMIDVVPMQQFQKDFFLIRQAEYQYYANALGPGAMQQGDLADPNYFDFISFAQYSTICREVNNPAVIFEEQQPVEVDEGQPQQFNSVLVKRDTTLSNKDLAQRHTEIVGNAILDKLIEKFGETPSAIPKIEENSRPDATTLLASIKQIVVLFLISGFAFDGYASIVQSGKGSDAAGAEFTIVASSPATLWSGQSLKVS